MTVVVIVVVERDTEVTVKVVVEQVGDAPETVVVTPVGKPVAEQLPVTVVAVTVTVGMDPPVEIVVDVFDEANEVDARHEQAELTLPASSCTDWGKGQVQIPLPCR